MWNLFLRGAGQGTGRNITGTFSTGLVVVYQGLLEQKFQKWPLKNLEDRPLQRQRRAKGV